MSGPESYAIGLGEFAETLALKVFLPQIRTFFLSEKPHWRASDLLATSACLRQTGPYSLADQCSLKLRDCAENLKYQFARR